MTPGLDDPEVVSGAADMSLADITRMRADATDVDEAMKNFDLPGARSGRHNITTADDRAGSYAAGHLTTDVRD